MDWTIIQEAWSVFASETHAGSHRTAIYGRTPELFFFLDIRCSAAFLKFSCLAQLVFECTLTPRIIIILSSCLQRLQGSYVQISRTYSRVVSTVNNILVSGQKQEFCRRIYGSRRIAETPLWTLLGYVSRRETTRISLKIVLFLCSWKSKKKISWLKAVIFTYAKQVIFSLAYVYRIFLKFYGMIEYNFEWPWLKVKVIKGQRSKRFLQ